MIKFSMTLIPYGIGLIHQKIITASIWTTDCGKYHGYIIWDAEDNVIHKGRLDKSKSGHRNPIELLHNVTSKILAERKEK